ncbi:hypothetical protein EDD85DRAFT_793356 [Armillaria nabsnona]|nr:hypothetical protein EDD85DRAFT_793356 [Armillaria nabsnona]
MDPFVDIVTQFQRSFDLKCALCHRDLDLLSTVDYRTPDGKTIVFGDAWSLECGHVVDSDCAYQLLEHRTMRSLLPPTGIRTHAFPVAKVWRCPERSCVAVYRSVYSHRSQGWTLAPDFQGHIRAMVPYAVHRFLGPLAPHIVPVRGNLGDLEDLGVPFDSLFQGIRRRWYPLAAPVSVEYATPQSLTYVPPIVVSISSIVASLSGSVLNGYVIDAIVAETLANHSAIAPEWPSHLDSFRESLGATDLYSQNLVLVAPGPANLDQPERHWWDIPRNQPASSRIRDTSTPPSSSTNPSYISEEEHSQALDVEAAQILLSLNINFLPNNTAMP